MTSFADQKVHEFIAMQASLYSDLSEEYSQMGKLYTARLWHQLTLQLLAFTSDPKSFRGTNLIELHENFIKTFEDQANQLQYALISTKIAEQYYPSRPYDLNQVKNAIDFLQNISGAGVLVAASSTKMEIEEEDSKGGASESKSDDKGAKTTPAAPVEDEATKILKQKKTKLTSAGYLVMLAAVIKLELLCGEVDKVKLLIDEAVELLDSMNGVEPIVYASVYHAKAEYHKLVGPAKDYYNTALQYLTYTPEDKLKGEDALHLAVDLVLASLVGENVYNFGEVLASPVMGLLVNSKSSWLHDIVKACNTGDIPAFNAIYSEHKADIAAQPALHSSIDVVKQKVALLAFVELVFHRPSNQRVIPFIDIAAATSLPVDQIEWLLMKSMSIGLVKGHIDELDKTITVTWVQPRVLDNNQMDSIRNKLNEWAKTSHSTLLYVENNVGELLK